MTDDYDARKDAHDSYFAAIEEKRRRGAVWDWVEPALIRYELPYPPTTNHLFITAGKRRVRSVTYKDWFDRAAWEIARQRRKRIKGPVSISIALVRPDKRRRDLSNAGLKAIEDLLVEMGCIEDDSLVQRISLQWVPDGPECVVLVQKHEGGVA